LHVFPDLVRLEKKYPNQIVVIGIHTPKFEHEKEMESIRRAMLRYGLNHPVYNDADRKVWQAYNVQSWPSLVLIDPEGYAVGGLATEHVFEQFDKAISQLIRTHRAKGTLVEGPSRFQKSATEPNTGALCFPGKVLADAASKRLFIADSTNNRVVITDLAGKKIAIAGTGKEGLADGPFEKATFNEPQGLALAGETLYVADRKNHLIRALDLKAKTVKTIAGTGRQAAFPPSKAAMSGGNPRSIPLNSPWDVLVVGNNLYIAMAGHHQIWAINLKVPVLTLFAGNSNEEIKDGPRGQASFAQPSGLSSDGQNLYVADSETSSIRFVPLNGAGQVQTIVGTGLFDFGDLDGVGPAVRLQHPLGVLALNRKLYVADTYNDKIKILDPMTRECKSFIGGGKGAEAMFNEPSGLSYADGKLYVADTNAHRIRVVSLLSREVTTLELQGVEAPKR
jgi:DNA-binding beta-propeller fold protein YncE